MLVTGGSRGIGRATALMAAERGWAVAVNYHSAKAEAEAVVATIRGQGGTAVALPADVTVEADVGRLFAEAGAALGGLDAVVINAGIVAASMTLAEMSAARLRKMVDTNLMGALLCAREAARILPRPREEASGAIVFVSSIAARLGSAGEYVDYAATKGAVDSLTLGLSRELAAQNIRVNAVRPGLIDTEIHASGGLPDRALRLGKLTPIGRPGTAEEVAEAIVWLCSEAASYTTGALLDVGGGR
ncbi:SDR family NAD(P)-dependent oxidoreductase [Paracoccus suum]|uniref:SDR family NAD(P)-dependent oxidoreductase n=1 Tax=Paracoccus suum TaxID=2259340 RepID=A0A344PIC5_9RHOB|nr:SDR family oxidoreductase [Paracoccus suum]AXC49130.1 SDR family NAD(P)-dependent oxidoreductase [Paracoccus suum]